MVADYTPLLFSASSRHTGPWPVLEVTGEIDLATAPRLQDHLIEAINAHQSADLIVDMTKVEFCDASGLRVLVRAQRWIQRRGGRLRVICPEGRLLRILRITTLTRLLSVHPTMEDALADEYAPCGTASYSRSPALRTGAG
ncbi:STAS domain-containing protein [Actinoallomurus sp. NBC_01490]|jgi:anti-sigma B factor antagonist|uniref:STAS domain-containing protein n=1 Tax=Actinoallomurus sp. NBC_01490 TaxID=2903557 RepID=UPI002E36C1A3|nr:STAS domain-containing protein [Actinoallomurus sp. NBC_01490]